MISFLIITIVTFTLFFLEGLIHFNMGVNCTNQQKHKTINLNKNIFIHIPDLKEALYMGITVLFFSSLTGFISSYFI
jgi:hypothetical protein